MLICIAWRRSGFGRSLTISVSNGSKLPGRFQVRFHPNPDRGNGSYHTKNPDCRKSGGFTTKNPAFEIDHFDSN